MGSNANGTDGARANPCEIEKTDTGNLKHRPIKGTCLLMCPNEELRRRQRSNLIHPLETKVNEKGERLRYADSRRMVKEFHRSAAGITMKSSDIRPLPVLKRTVNYLLSVVCSCEDASWREIYDFANDRLRAVRQDITVQGLSGNEVIDILTRMARFYIYAHYRLCEYGTNEFDPYLNLQQLHEVLVIIIAILKDKSFDVEAKFVDYSCKLRKTNKQTSNRGVDHQAPETTNPGIDHYAAENTSPSIINESNADTCESETTGTCAGVSRPNPIPCESFTSDLLGPREETPNSQIEYKHNDIVTPLENLCINETTNEKPENTNLNVQCPYTNIRSTNFLKEIDKNVMDIRGENEFCLYKYSTIEEVIALYLLINLGQAEAVAKVMEMPKTLRNSSLVSKVVQASLSWGKGNHIPLVRLAAFVTPIIGAALHLHLNKVQRHALGILSVAHNSKVLRYSTVDLQRYLLFSSIESLQKACQYYGLSSSTDGIEFQRGAFKWDVPVFQSKKVNWLEEKLKDFTIPELLLGYCDDVDE